MLVKVSSSKKYIFTSLSEIHKPSTRLGVDITQSSRETNSYKISPLSSFGLHHVGLQSSIIHMQFWWNKEEGKTIHLLSWSYIQKPIGEGGLGIRDLKAFNQVLLTKIAWRIISNLETSLAKALLNKNCKNSNFLQSFPKPHNSWVWKRILHGRNLLVKGVEWRAGTGNSINILNDHWLPEPPHPKLLHRSPLTPTLLWFVLSLTTQVRG